VLVELPFSSLQLTPAVAERLRLKASQKEAIQQVMTRERRQIEPLIAQSRTIREKLLALDPQHGNKKQIKTLADAQAALLAKVIVANARMRSEIYKVLTPEQQRKLEDLKRSSD
jgi:Spy/CpxP family protein refolding chaperone